MRTPINIEIPEDVDSETLKNALKWAVLCFKSRAMTMTSDHLKTELEDILKGQAKVNWFNGKLSHEGL